MIIIQKKYIQKICIALLVVLLAAPVLSVAAESLPEQTGGNDTTESGNDSDTARQTIRVAFPTQEGMSFFGHSGKVTGYNYDYLEKISEYTGWEMEYVPYGSADGNEAVGNAINDLMEGKVDLLGPLLKNDSTEELFEFPQKSYGTVYTTLNALSSGPLRENNLYNVDILRVGLWEKAETRNEEVLNFLKFENLPYEIVYFETSEEQMDALNNGTVDVISSVSLSPVANARIVAQFAPRPYYFASTKGNTDLIQKLDEAIALIDQIDPNLQDTLYNNYFRVASDAFWFSDEQKAELAKIGTLHVLCTENTAPYAYKLDGNPAGVLVSALDDFATDTGLTVEYTFCSDREEVRKKLAEGDYDILIGVPLTSSLCAELGFINSAPVLQSLLAYAQHPTKSTEDISSQTIALVKGLEEQIPTDGYADVLVCDNSKACVAAVENGMADVAAGPRAALEYYIYEDGSNLVTSMIPGQIQNAVISVNRNCDTVLLTVMNNYIYSISEDVLANYLSVGNLHPESLSLVIFLRHHPVQGVLIVLLVTVLIASIVVFMLTRSAKQRASMEAKHNSQLKEALQIAQDANEAKSTFLSNMSHDIRTPMNAVIGFSTLLAREPGNEVKVREYARKIGAASNHLLGLINDILDISKIESGKMSIHQSVFSIDELMESINTVIRPMAGEKKQSFHINMGQMSHELFVGDKTRINQVLINLLSNAIKYTQAGGEIRFEVEDLGSSSSSVERIRFVVADNGYGITDEFKKIIFDPFTRAENSTVNKEVGTGLGLAITKNIINLMGGVIDLESEPGKGSTFTVELPLQLPHEEADEHFWENHHISHMLIVDDDKNICDGVMEHMEEEHSGVTFDAAYSGEKAVELVKEKYASGEEYDTIILDWQMPGMNGLDAAREIRKIVPIDTPVLFLTSYDWTEIETEALEIDVDGFLAKPFTTMNLKEKLIEVEHFKNSVFKEDVALNLNGMHFLLAEDNELNAEIITELLKAEGADCEVVDNGELAVWTFTSSEAHSYDAILMDVMMPVLNGYEATKAIRRSDHPEALTIPIVAMTANAFVKDVQDALDAGMNAHIAKPINMETLKNTLGSCIKQ